MKTLKTLSFLLAAGALSWQQANADGLSVNFSTAQGYVGGNSSLAGQQGWVTNDPLNMAGTAGDTSFVHFVAGYTPGSSGAGNNSVEFGGVAAGDEYFPGNVAPELSKTFTSPTSPGSLTHGALFSTDFAIIGSSDPSFPAKDTFGFDLRNSVGASLAKFVFNPAAATLSDLRFQWILNGVTQTTSNPALNGNNEIGYGSKYRFNVSLSNSSFTAILDTLNASNVVTQTATLISNGALSDGLQAPDFSDIAITWNLSNTSTPDPGVYENAGSNYIIVNSVAVTAVPEPSTILMALGLVGFVMFRSYRRLSAR